MCNESTLTNFTEKQKTFLHIFWDTPVRLQMNFFAGVGGSGYIIYIYKWSKVQIKFKLKQCNSGVTCFKSNVSMWQKTEVTRRAAITPPPLLALIVWQPLHRGGLGIVHTMKGRTRHKVLQQWDQKADRIFFRSKSNERNGFDVKCSLSLWRSASACFIFHPFSLWAPFWCKAWSSVLTNRTRGAALHTRHIPKLTTRPESLPPRTPAGGVGRGGYFSKYWKKMAPPPNFTSFSLASFHFFPPSFYTEVFV